MLPWRIDEPVDPRSIEVVALLGALAISVKSTISPPRESLMSDLLSDVVLA
jgi:hypothetical protein